MMVRERAVDVAIQRDHFAADAFEHGRRECARDAVAAVDDDFQLALDLDVVGDPADVVLADVERLQAAHAVDEAPFGDARYSAWIASSDSVSPPSTILKPL